ncbi:Chalcone-flavanone isomerase family protein isoform 3 [Theobroma cacao]|uniref:Chalcone-flavanone isomerase family protein isoform 3 n=1 Tax=Theobroma cacao TaxID=3641 RepID=A0A061GLQ2_THECC|nr:Chalcone-flavanone isomerase family protein isoform 3 [Theobroma cacao]
MRSNWLLFMDLDGGGSPYIFAMEPFVSNGLGAHLFSQFSSLVDSSLYHSKHMYVPGSLAFREAFGCMSRFAGTLLFWFSSMSTSNLSRDISAGNQRGLKSGSCKSSAKVKHIASCKNYVAGFQFASESSGQSATPLVFGKISSYAMRHFFGEVEALQSFPLLSLAAALIPPFDNLSAKVLAVPLENTEVQTQECMDQRRCDVGLQGCGSLSFLDLNWTRHAVEPRTGIEFPMILDNILDRQNNSSLASEVLVGTGSRTMKIIKIKSLKVYAFGFYIHPYSVCQKLGPKYASIPAGELHKHNDFYQDLLREDIGMTVRLVVNCNGMKVNTVRDAFEKSLRARLVKTNPNTDYHCLSTFGSYFTQDIPLPAGTIIDFQRTADGQLITKSRFFFFFSIPSQTVTTTA